MDSDFSLPRSEIVCSVDRLRENKADLAGILEDADFGSDARRQIDAIDELIHRYNAILERPTLFDGQHGRALTVVFGAARKEERQKSVLTAILLGMNEADRQWTRLSTQLCSSVAWPLPRPVVSGRLQSECAPQQALNNLAMGGLYLGDDYASEYASQLLHSLGHILIERQHRSLVADTKGTYPDALTAPEFLADSAEPNDEIVPGLHFLGECVDVSDYAIPAQSDPAVVWLELICDMLATYVMGRPYLLELAYHANRFTRRLYSKACSHLPACRAVLAAMDIPDLPSTSFSLMVEDCSADIPWGVFDDVARRVVSVGQEHGIKSGQESLTEDPEGLVATAHSYWAQKGIL